jgi:cytochrome c oxidase subunit 2
MTAIPRPGRRWPQQGSLGRSAAVHHVFRGAVMALALLTSACDGVQSALAPAGREAADIARLFWWMTGGALLIWACVIALALYVARADRRGRDPRAVARLLIVGGGVAFPAVVLTLLLVYGLAMLPPLVRRAPPGSVTVDVHGEMWWWRIRYRAADGAIVELANELALPAGEPAQFVLTSDNVIHSFWIPSLGGKMDMIPGRTTYLALHPTVAGLFRGACAEYCGTSHALMGFHARVLPREDFDRWLAHQASPAASPQGELARRGQQLFLANGCHACHTVRGTEARGVIGPDLTHVGSRTSVGAGILPNEPDALHRWVAQTADVKPGVHMPPFGMLGDEELRAMAAYLAALK